MWNEITNPAPIVNVGFDFHPSSQITDYYSQR